jgi:branched-chain amino acid transport system ATP-binding protein
MSMLQIDNLQVSYGGIQALRGISLEVSKNEIVTLIGANGAGKSSTLRAVSGLVPPKGGKIIFEGEDITRMDAQQVVARGLIMVPEGRRVFPNLTVEENLKIGAYLEKDHAKVRQRMEYAYESFPRLKERHWQPAGTLSGGEQQMLAVGRAVMAGPKLLMMDEPSLGLAPLVVRDIFAIIRQLSQEGMTILLIEQNANAALRAAHRGYVMETGRIILSGTGEELLNDQAVRDAYLGQSARKAKKA